MSLLRSSLDVLRTDRRALIVLSSVYLGLFGLGILVSALAPDEAFVADPAGGELSPGMAEFFEATFASKNVALTALAVFGVNFFAISVIQTTIPSFIIPFVGVLLTGFRLFMWGIIFTPIGEEDPSFLVHWVTLLIEGAAYVLVAFAAWVHGRMFLQPSRYGIEGRGRGYLEGLKATGKIYIWVFILLVIGALYESVTLIYVLN